ncbi:hypothetical protein GYH30_056902 [Glycine max]|nr:hypothetical protein GYH30_056902 [Glycine max]
MRGTIAEILLSLLSVWPCLSLEIYEKDKKFSGLWHIVVGDLSNIICYEDGVCREAEIQCRFSTCLPANQGVDILNIYLNSSHHDCPPSYDNPGHYCLHSCLHANWLGNATEFQTRMLFNQAFSRGLQISRILGGQRKGRSSRNKE